MKTIAIIEDDEYIGGLLTEALTEEGYGVVRAYSGTEALMLLEKKRPDLILMDLMLPGLSGENLLPRCKGIPVIVVSAKAGVEDKVKLLLDGAVDYVTKPFHVRELLARIEVRLREAQEPETAILRADGLRMDTVTREVWAGESPVHLTRTEFAILKILMLNPTQVISKSALLDKISSDTPDCGENSLKVHISNLRKKLKTAGGREYIEAVWGIGFKLV